jgi:glycosyltransferase involved in cell wall biosynthesis
MSSKDQEHAFKVSVGMPAYNGEKFICTAIESILSQSYSNFELIISDDASTDRTQEILRKYCLEDSRIKYIRQHKNIGADKNFKKVLDAATGEFFMFASQDDLFSPNWLSCLTLPLKEMSNCASFGSTIYIDEVDKIINSTANNVYFNFSESKVLRRVKFLFTPHLTGKMILLYSIFPTDLIRTLCADNTKITGVKSEDLHFIFLALKRLKFIPTTGCYIYKRVHPQSDSILNSHTQKNADLINPRNSNVIFSNSFLKKIIRILLPTIELSGYIKKLSKSEFFVAIITAPFFLPYHAIYGIYLMLKKRSKDVS